MFAADKHGKSACYGSCAVYWPPLLTSSRHVAGSGVKASLLGTTMRTGGKLQVTYNGHPLYRFVKDSKPGQTSGQGLNLSGGLWWVISPTGTVVKRTASTAPPTTTGSSSGGGGYGP
jgi:predicted lipoprotein with Yx(FWY)xxD motif